MTIVKSILKRFSKQNKPTVSQPKPQPRYLMNEIAPKVSGVGNKNDNLIILDVGTLNVSTTNSDSFATYTNLKVEGNQAVIDASNFGSGYSLRFELPIHEQSTGKLKQRLIYNIKNAELTNGKFRTDLSNVDAKVVEVSEEE